MICRGLQIGRRDLPGFWVGARSVEQIGEDAGQFPGAGKIGVRGVVLFNCLECLSSIGVKAGVLGLQGDGPGKDDMGLDKSANLRYNFSVLASANV